jgi:TolB protein
LQYYSVASTATVDAVDEKLGNFLSPGWSPVDDRILFISLSDGISRLTVLNNDMQQILVDNLDGLISFSWSPDGQYIAYRVVDSNSVSSVHVINSETGELVAKSNVSGIIAFFWSPDSSKIAYITLSNPPGTFDINNKTSGNVTFLTQETDGLAWNILDISDSSNEIFASFIPTLDMQYLLSNFDQFAQSHSLWSPDSTHLVYSELTGIDSSDSLITILDVNDPNATPQSIAKGSFAVWSYR